MNMKDSTKPLGRGGTIPSSVRCMKKEKEKLRGFHMNDTMLLYGSLERPCGPNHL